MTDKTKEAIDIILRKAYDGDDWQTREQALAKICAIVDEERKGEVVLFDGSLVIESSSYGDWLGDIQIKHNIKRFIDGKRGELVFRPREE